MAPVVVDNISIVLEPDRVVRRLRIHRTPGHEALVQSLIKKMTELVQPGAMYLELPVTGKSHSWVEVGGARFTSRLLSRHMSSTPHAYPYLVTLGPRVECAVSGASNILEQYCLNEIANLALDQVRENLREYIEKHHVHQTLYSLAPGSLDDWPIEEQRALFALLGDTEAHLGVQLAESLLMVPIKSLSGLFFTSDRPFVSCRFCDFQECSNRQAAFDPSASDARKESAPCRL